MRIHRRLPLLPLILALVAVARTQPARAPPPGLDDYVTRVMQAFDVPGALPGGFSAGSAAKLRLKPPRKLCGSGVRFAAGQRL